MPDDNRPQPLGEPGNDWPRLLGRPQPGPSRPTPNYVTPGRPIYAPVNWRGYWDHLRELREHVHATGQGAEELLRTWLRGP